MPRPQPLRCIDIGAGAPVVILHAFAMRPRRYLPLRRLLAKRARVLIPDLFALSQWREIWSFQHILDCLAATLDDRGIARATVVGHSYGGGIELGFAAHWPDRVEECVFADTLGPKRQLSLAREATRPIGLVRTATRPAAFSFIWSWATHPVQLAAGAVDGYLSKRSDDIEAVARAGVRCHVLWAARDEILSRDDGEDFAKRLNATFTAAEQPAAQDPIDHDWVFDHPELFVTYLEKLRLRVLSETA